MRSPIRFLAAAIACSLFPALVCSCGPKAGGSDKEVVIAVVGPMTGSAAAYGEQITNAAKIKMDEVNAAGGIDGKTVRIVFEDDKGDATEATNVARKIVSNADVCVIIGHFNSVCTNSGKEEYNRKKIASISPGSTAINVCKGYDWTFRNLYRDDYQGTFLAQYAKKKLGLNRIAVFYDNDDYGNGLKDAFVKEADKIGLGVVATDSYIRERTQDFKPLVQKAQAANPDAIFVAGLYNEAALIAKAARGDLGMKVEIFGGEGLIDQKLIEIAGESAEGIMITTPFLFDPQNDTPEARKFFESYTKACKKEPGTWAALTYDAVGMAIEAIRASGPDRLKIRDWLAACTTAEKGYKGVTGLTFFDAEGDCYSKPAYVAVVKDNKFAAAEKQMTAEEMK